MSGADPVAKALGGLDGLLTQFYQACLPMLAQGGLDAGPVRAMADSGVKMMNGMLGAMTQQSAAPWPALPEWPGATQLSQLAAPWSGLLRGLFPGLPGNEPAAANALQLGIERTFGGLRDAFGLAPMRDLEQAWRDMLVASANKQRAQVEYLALAAEAFSQGTQQLLQELAAMGGRGERVESMLALLRLWARAIDGPMHDTMQAERGLAVTAKVIRASTQHRAQLQKAIGLASEALHVPTRADVDEAYREIQELKRELRQIRKLLPPRAAAAAVPAPTEAPDVPVRKRAGKSAGKAAPPRTRATATQAAATPVATGDAA